MMSSRRNTSLSWGAGMLLVGFAGFVLFVFNPTAGAPILSTLQFFVKQITLEFLQVMTAIFILGGIVLLIDGLRTP